MIHEWHTGNKRMHVWLFQPGQITFDQYRVSGDAGETALPTASKQVLFLNTTGQLINNL